MECGRPSTGVAVYPEIGVAAVVCPRHARQAYAKGARIKRLRPAPDPARRGA